MARTTTFYLLLAGRPRPEAPASAWLCAGPRFGIEGQCTASILRDAANQMTRSVSNLKPDGRRLPMPQTSPVRHSEG